MDMGVGIEAVMSEDREKMDNDLAMIVGCLERQTAVLQGDHDALLMLVRRVDGFGVEMRVVSETLKTIAHRQSELEATSERRRVNCAEVMQNLVDRIVALENDATPIPKEFTAETLAELHPGRLARGIAAGNGHGDTRLSLSAAAADDAVFTIDESDEDEE